MNQQLTSSCTHVTHKQRKRTSSTPSLNPLNLKLTTWWIIINQILPERWIKAELQPAHHPSIVFTGILCILLINPGSQSASVYFQSSCHSHTPHHTHTHTHTHTLTRTRTRTDTHTHTHTHRSLLSPIGEAAAPKPVLYDDAPVSKNFAPLWLFSYSSSCCRPSSSSLCV